MNKTMSLGVFVGGQLFHHPLMDTYPEFEDQEICVSVERIEFYFNRRSEGMTHNFAAMLACQRAPGANTEQIYFEGRHTLAEQFKGNEAQLEAVVAAARAKGYNPSYTDIYEPHLADDMGDPNAFIKPSGGTTEYRRKLEKAGKSAYGLIKVKGRKPKDPPKNVPLAQDIIDKIVDAKVANNPDLLRKATRRDLADDVCSEHGYSENRRSGMFRDNGMSRDQIKAIAPPPEDSRSHYRERALKARKKRKKL